MRLEKKTVWVVDATIDRVRIALRKEGGNRLGGGGETVGVGEGYTKKMMME